MLKGSLRLAALASLFMTGAAFAQEKIKVGVTATLEGTYTVLGEDGMRGFQTALNKFGTKIGDKQLEFVVASTDATPDSAVRAVRKLIEQDKVQILLSPLSGDEGIGKELRQDAPGTDVHQRSVGRAGNHLRRSGAKFLPLQHGRRPVAGWLGQICL
jgi:hypothetical protein